MNVLVHHNRMGARKSLLTDVICSPCRITIEGAKETSSCDARYCMYVTAAAQVRVCFHSYSRCQMGNLLLSSTPTPPYQSVILPFVEK